MRKTAVVVAFAMGVTATEQAPSAPPPLGPVCGGRCGVERWDVKTLSDPDRARVNLTAVDATIEALAALPRGQAQPGHERIAPVELTTYRVTGHLAAAFTEKDHDWHLVLYGLQNQRVSIIAEIPDPACSGACRSGFSEAFARARAALEEHLKQANLRDEPILVQVTGVGFFDFPHGQVGVAPNAFELHPVLEIVFLK